MAEPKNARVFNGVQALRFFAALLVVVTHATGMATERMLGMGPGHYWFNGQSGVDIFFVISGFVMAVSSFNGQGHAMGWKTFAERRLLRVVPMYWIATTLKIAMVLAVPAVALHTVIDPMRVLFSYLFLPSFNEQGEILPLLTVGWTLQYEMFFYLFFTLALLLKRPPLWFCGIAFALLSAVGLSDMRGASAFWSYTTPMMLEFIYGMAIARFCARPRLGAAPATALVVIGVALLLSVHTYVRWRAFEWGLPAALVVLGVVQLEPWLGRRIPRWLLEQGAASYVLYLFHPFLVPAVGVALVKLHVLSVAAAVMLCLLLSPIMALIIHRYIETPLNRHLKTATAPGGMFRRKAASYGN